MLSDDKISQLTHVLVKALLDKKLIKPAEGESKIRKTVKQVIATEMKHAEEMDQAVRRKLDSYSKRLFEGSPEWEIQYRKFFKEEEIKRGRS